MPLPVAEMRLPQSGVDLHRHSGALAERDRGVQRPPQVRGHDQQWLTLGQHLGGGDGLVPAQVGQIGVELALHPAARVVLGLPVPQHDQAADPHARSALPSRSTGTTRAVAPQPIQRVEVALVLVLDVHHDVDVVEQRPPALAGAFAAGRFVPRERASSPRPRRRWR